MKNTIFRIFSIGLAAGIISICMCSCKNKEKSIEIDLAKVVEANNTDRLLALYGSFSDVQRIDGEETVFIYVDNEIDYYRYADGYKSVSGDDFQFICEDGKYYGYLLCDGNYKDKRANIQMSDSTLDEKVVSAIDNGRQITVLTTLGEDQTIALLADLEAEYLPGDTMRLQYLLDSKTLALQSASETLVHTDGTTADLGTLQVTYGIARTEDAVEMLERAKPANDLRTLTIVLDPNTDREQMFTKTVRKGDIFGFLLPEGYALYSDEGCTVPSVENESIDTNAHVLLFAKAPK